MSHRDALLAALHEDPSDRASWSVLADCLDDEGEPERAELVRIRVLLMDEVDTPARAEAEDRQRVLLAQGVTPCVPLLVNSVGMELALMPAGVFMMGSPAEEAGRRDDLPCHRVEIACPFHLGVYPVTQGQYERLTGGSPSSFSLHGENRSEVAGLDTSTFPVENVSWEDAVGFCARLSNLPAERAAGRVYRLPTEAEWEYACRAGVRGDPFHQGSGLSSRWANFNGARPAGGAPRGPSLGRTCAVGSYRANAWVLYDLHGNVWEWCHDWYQPPASVGQPGPLAGPTDQRGIRGGAWNFVGIHCRTASRLALSPTSRGRDLGFRVACVAGDGRP